MIELNKKQVELLGGKYEEGKHYYFVPSRMSHHDSIINAVLYDDPSGLLNDLSKDVLIADCTKVIKKKPVHTIKLGRK